MSASTRPSPGSGSRNVCDAMRPPDSVGQRAVDYIENPIKIRKIILLNAAWRIWDVKTTHPQHRCLQRVEALLGDACGKLSTHPEIQLGLVHSDRPTGLLHRLDDHRHVERRQGAEI